MRVLRWAGLSTTYSRSAASEPWDHLAALQGPQAQPESLAPAAKGQTSILKMTRTTHLLSVGLSKATKSWAHQEQKSQVEQKKDNSTCTVAKGSVYCTPQDISFPWYWKCWIFSVPDTCPCLFQCAKSIQSYSYHNLNHFIFPPASGYELPFPPSRSFSYTQL